MNHLFYILSVIAPYLQPIQLENMDTIQTIQTTFNQDAIVTRRANDILAVKLSDAATIEIGQIDTNRFVVINTCGAPERESTCFLCDSLCKNKQALTFDTLNFYNDSVTADKKKLVEFPLIEAHLADTPKALTLTMNAPMLNAEEKKQLSSALSPRKLLWNGTTYKP